MKLKPCPVCGGDARLIENVNDKGFLDMSVECQKCGDSINITTLPEFREKMRNILCKSWEFHKMAFANYTAQEKGPPYLTKMTMKLELE